MFKLRDNLHHQEVQKNELKWRMEELQEQFLLLTRPVCGPVLEVFRLNREQKLMLANVMIKCMLFMYAA